MKRIAIGFLAMAMVLFSSSNAEATQSVHTDQEIRTYVIDSFTGDVLGQLSDLQINQDRIGFSYSEKSFMFDLQETNINSEANNNLNGARYYYGLADKLVCSVVEFNDAYCIKVTNKAESLINRKKDRETNFTIVSAGLTNVSGSWAIDAATGTFMAETTVTATVNNLPISWSLYDVTDMYGVHQ